MIYNFIQQQAQRQAKYLTNLKNATTNAERQEIAKQFREETEDATARAQLEFKYSNGENLTDAQSAQYQKELNELEQRHANALANIG